jgi:hypothetical protein
LYESVRGVVKGKGTVCENRQAAASLHLSELLVAGETAVFRFSIVLSSNRPVKSKSRLDQNRSVMLDIRYTITSTLTVHDRTFLLNTQAHVAPSCDLFLNWPGRNGMILTSEKA